MKHHLKFLGFLAAAILLLLAACNRGEQAAPTDDPSAFYTQAIETAYAQLTQTAQAIPTETPTPTITLTLDPALQTPSATATLAAGQPSPTPLPTRLVGTAGQPTQQSCDNFLLLRDVSIPDGTVIGPGESFEKTWELQNVGPCTWTGEYRLVWAYGDWYGTEPVYMYYTVPPGDTIQLTVTLTAPTTPGNYFAAFIMQNDRGVNFGIPNYLTVYIVVPATPTP
ncbi:MAG: NBR1-Ig-like domain-containing protein [Anaerolineales bacterium]